MDTGKTFIFILRFALPTSARHGIEFQPVRSRSTAIFIRLTGLSPCEIGFCIFRVPGDRKKTKPMVCCCLPPVEMDELHHAHHAPNCITFFLTLTHPINPNSRGSPMRKRENGNPQICEFRRFLRRRARNLLPLFRKTKISISPILVLAIFRTMCHFPPPRMLVGTCRPTPIWGRGNGKGNPAPG